MAAKHFKYRHTNIPSVLQGEVPDGQEIDYLTGKRCPCDFHHVLGGNDQKKRKACEQYGLWVWLERENHQKLHDTREGQQFSLTLKQRCQIAFEREHTREMWMKIFHKNYL